MSESIIISVHLGTGEEGTARKRALETLAADAGHYWNEEPSIGRWMIAQADKYREELMNEYTIVEAIYENGRHGQGREVVLEAYAPGEKWFVQEQAGGSAGTVFRSQVGTVEARNHQEALAKYE